MAGPALPESRGRISAGVAGFLRGKGVLPDSREIAGADPFGDDLQLALYLCYELHYRGFAKVDSRPRMGPGAAALPGGPGVAVPGDAA